MIERRSKSHIYKNNCMDAQTLQTFNMTIIFMNTDIHWQNNWET